MTRIACHQLAPRIGDLAANQTAVLDAITTSVSAGDEIIVLPELVLSGYVFASYTEAASLAIPADSPLLEEWAETLADSPALVVGGFAERGPDGLLYNSAALVDASGVRSVYRKTHLWDTEKRIFTPGDAAPPIVQTPAGRIAVMICYDLEFPELTRAVALAGAELIVAPVNWPLVPRPAGERPPEVLIAMAAARVNHLAIACCDRTGTERGQQWTTGTTIIDENGWVVATAARNGCATADLDLSQARDKTLTPLCDAFGDRRPNLYATLYRGILTTAHDKYDSR